MKLKRLLITVGMLVFCLCLGLAIVGCDDSASNGHTTHTGSEWKSDDTKHWKLCTQCAQRFDEAAHTFKDGVCEICGRKEAGGSTEPGGTTTPGGADYEEIPGDPNCIHEWDGSWKDLKAKTCTEDGVQARTCRICGRREVRPIESTGHRMVDRAGKPATCTEPGVTDYEYCTVCGYSTEKEIPPLNHDLETIPAEAATCTKVGWTQYKKCKRCDYNTLDDEDIPEDHYITMIDHIYESEAEDAECTMCHKTRFKASEGLEIVEAGTIARVVGIGTCTDTIISIPEDYNGRPVTEIADDAFSAYKPQEYGSMSADEKAKIDAKIAQLKQVKEVKMRGILRIGDSAFFYMEGMEKIDLGENLQRIGRNSFSMCSKLQTIHLPKTCTSIEYSSFYRCDSMTSITVDENNNAFTVLEGRYLVTKMTAELKYVCTTLSAEGKVTIPEGIRVIGQRAFDSHMTIEELTIPSTVQNIETQAFFGCRAIKKVVVEAGVVSIGSGAFAGCASLEEFHIYTKEVTEKDENGNDVKRQSFKYIYANCFSYCFKLTTVTYHGTMEQWKQVQKYGDGLLNDELNYVNVGNGQTQPVRVFMTIQCDDGTLKENQNGQFQ